MRVFRNGKLLGRETEAGEWGTSKVRLEKDGRLTFSSETKDENWTVAFEPMEVEMITTEMGGVNQMTLQELSKEVDRRLRELEEESGSDHPEPSGT
ncbi:MAG: hypothetical protein ABSF83_05470 [Nitrososphaerales archaeon]